MKKSIVIFLTATLVLTNFQGWQCLKQVDLFKNFDLIQGIEKSYADENVTEEGIRYYIDNNQAIVMGAEDSVSGDVVIPETIDGYTVTTMDEYAFSYAKSITSISIPKTVTKIYYGIGYKSTKLSAINVDSENKNYCSVDGVLFDKGMKTIVRYPEAKSGDTYNIPDGVINIGDQAFLECNQLSNINMSEAVMTIGYEAFSECKLSNINIPDGVTTIEGHAFADCILLKNIEIPQNVTVISDCVFEGCKSLENINIPENITKIESCAFKDCEALKSIEIPQNVTEIGESAFSGCSLLQSINIPQNVTKIGKNTFNNCKALTSINVDSQNNNYSSTDGVLFDKDKKQIIRYPQAKTGDSYTIPDGVTEIGESAFSGCSLLESIKIPKDVATIGESAFNRCNSLVNLEIPKGLTVIEDYVFSHCESLTSIEIPEGVTSIGYGAFMDCYELAKVYIPKSVTTIDETAFEECYSIRDKNKNDEGIYGYEGSYAETYAGEHNIAFNVMEELTDLGLEYHTKEEIKEYVSKYLNLSQKVTYSENPNTVAPYSIGKLSDETLTSAINTLNTMRYIAGISHDITLSDSYNEYAQAASFINYVNDDLSHSPTQPSDMDDELYNLCARGCGSTNLAWGYGNLNRAIVNGWLSDEDEYNIATLPHRRWVLNPDMKSTGFGATGRYYAMYSFDKSGSSDAKVTWPARVMPINYFSSDYPWSFSLGEVISDVNSVNVTLTNKTTGKVWNFNSGSADGYFKVNNQGYGKKGCIIFRPDGIDSYKDGEVYNVKITGSFDTIVYNVEFFDLDSVNTANEVTFDADNGTDVTKVKVNKGDTLNYTPETPTKEGYTFVGWYKDVDDTTTEYQNNATYNQDVTYKAKWAHVTMLGAQGKVIVDDKSGIRFGTKIYDDGDEIVEKGTLIIPVSVLGDQKLTLETPKVAKSVANILYDENKEENYVTYLGTLVGIPRSQFGAEITASSYVIYRDKFGNEYTVYALYQKGFTTINKLLGL